MDKELEDLELITQDELPVGYVVDGHGIVRNEFGKFVKHFALPPAIRKKAKEAHRVFKRKVKMTRMLDDEFGPNCVSLIDMLSNIIFYDQAKEGHRWSEWKSSERLKALELALSYRHGRPHTHKKIDQTVDIKYDAKISVINELIEKNKDKLKLIVDNTNAVDAEFEEEEIIDEVVDLGQ
jgi:hypothetical protein